MGRRTFYVESDLSATPNAAERIGTFCRKEGIEGHMLAVIELCAVEAMNNAIEHGHGSADDVPVEVEIEVEGDEITIRVHDHGSGMPAEVLTRVQTPVDEVALDDLPERGLGLVILRRAMDELTYGASDRGNALTMRKRLPPRTERRVSAG